MSHPVDATRHPADDGKPEAAQFLSTLKSRLEEGDFGAEFGL